MQPTNPSTQKAIEAIRSAFGGNDPTNAGVIEKAKVLEWMSSPHLDIRGTLYSKITHAECVRHIEPPLQFEDLYGFVIPYLEQCIEQNLDCEWVDSRYLAGHQLVAWIVDFWNNKAVPRKRLDEIKHRLAALYKRGDNGVRDAVVNGVLEHLFENRQLMNFFKEWKDDPILARAYKDAQLWSEKM